MIQVLQVRCPNCQSVLRVPADWLVQAVRCKHCQQIFQGKPRPVPADVVPVAAAAPQAAVAVELPRVRPAKQHAVNLGRPLHETRPAPAGRSLGGGIKNLAAALLFLAAVGGMIFGGYKLSQVLQAESPEQAKQPDAVAVVSSGEKRPVSEPSRDKKKDPPKKDNDPAKKDPPKTEPKVEDPKKDPPKKKVPTDDPVIPPQLKPPPEKVEPKLPPVVRKGNEPFPRRALLISVSDYAYWNPVHYGSPPDPKLYPSGSSVATLAALLTKAPFSIQDDQITELSDAMPAGAKSARRPHDPLKQVIETTLDNFLDSSRPQDRIVVFFVGHAIDVEKECFLVPLDGNRDDVKTLIPLADIYKRLVKCKARQKLLVLDVCRYSPIRGTERPGPDEMSDQLNTLLQSPPVGVQVWASCIKGQKSIELPRGGVFMHALCTVLRKAAKAQDQAELLPLSSLVPEVNQAMKELLDPHKLAQASRLSGDPIDNGSAYNPDEKMPDRLTIQPAKVAGDGLAPEAQVRAILEEINRLPPARGRQNPLHLLPPFKAKDLEPFQADGSWDEIKELVAKKPEKYPLRKAVFDAVAVLNDSQKLVMEDRIPNPSANPLPGNIKAGYLNKQKGPSVLILDLTKALEELKNAGEFRKKESKRWQAHYDFTVARLQSRLIYIYEYNYLLGSIRQDRLPDLEKGVHNGWRLVAVEKPQVVGKEARVKDMVKQVGKAWRRIMTDYEGTPWAAIAAREQVTSLGLEWKASRD